MRRREWLKSGSAVLLAASGPASAQDRPTIRIVVPYVAGGQTDLLARLMVPLLAKALEQSVIVENKPGAAALIATRAVQTAPPDGRTLLFHNSGFVALPMLSKSANYDAVKDFEPVSRVGLGPNFLVINGDVPARTLPEFIAWARSRREPIMAANSGLNSGGHLSSQLFAKRAGIEVVHVPYKGSAETANALINGEVQFQLTSPTSVLSQQAKLGKVRFLAVATKERSLLAPDLPLVSDTVPGFVISGWFGILAPAGTPAPELRRLAQAFRLALEDTEVRERFIQYYMEPAYLGEREFAADIGDSIRFWTSIVSELNIQPS